MIWSNGSDDEVRAHLSKTLSALSHGNEPEDLRLNTFTSKRAAYLTAVKRYHPNRFARRPNDIQKLANEVFLALDSALNSEDAAKVNEQNPSPVLPAVKVEPTKRARGRDKLREARARATRARGSSVAPMPTKPKPEQSRKKSSSLPKALNEVEADFQKAKISLRDGLLEQAAEEFRTLAVAVPMDKRFRLYRHVATARVYIRQENFDKAAVEIDRALKLDSDFKEAHIALSELQNAKKKGGIFSRLFRR